MNNRFLERSAAHLTISLMRLKTSHRRRRRLYKNYNLAIMQGNKNRSFSYKTVDKTFEEYLM